MPFASSKTLRQLWWAPLLCFGFAWAISQVQFVREVEWQTLDWRTKYRLDFQPPPDPRVAVVLFDDDTEIRLGEPWPVDRQYHAQLTQVLALAGAKVIVWDVIFDASRKGDGDTIMGQVAAAAAAEGVFVVSAAATHTEAGDVAPGSEGPTRPVRRIEGDLRKIYGEPHALIPFPQLRENTVYGFADAHPGSDGIRRQVPLLVRIGEQVFPSLALQSLLRYLGATVDDLHVRLGEAITLTAQGKTRRIPIDAAGNFFVNYRYDQIGHASDLPTFNYGAILVSLSEIYLEQKPPSKAPPDFKGRVVFLGQVVKGKADAGPSPLRDLTPLTHLQANVLLNLLNEDFVWRVPERVVWGVALLVAYAWLLLVADLSVLVLCGGAILAMVAYFAAALVMWISASAWLPLVGPLTGFGAFQFATIGWRVWREQKAKQEIKGMFGSYLAPAVVEQLIKSDRRPELGGSEEEITAYFSDIQGYSSFSELLTPKQLVALLNEYLTVCTDAVQEQGGTLDKYIGDAIVAMFGAPIALPDHAYRACLAALTVHQRLDELRAKWNADKQTPWPETVKKMRTRIGVNSGPAVIGNMGSRTRFSYTMTGDNVNLAARMESGAKKWGSYLMCAGATKEACERHGGDRVVFRALGKIVVMGRSQPVDIFDVVGLKESTGDRTRECVATFEAALARYYESDWAGALAGFEASAPLEPLQPGKNPGVKSNPSLEYQRIVRELSAHPPGPAWDGIYVMREK